MQAPPAAPLLERGANGLVVTFTSPKGVANAALYLHVEGGAKRFYCTAARAVLAAGTSGSMLTVQARGAQHQIVVSDGLAEGKTSATICYRAANAMDCGPESPHSNTLELARPPAPSAPNLTPSAKGRVKVAYSLSALSLGSRVAAGEVQDFAERGRGDGRPDAGRARRGGEEACGRRRRRRRRRARGEAREVDILVTMS